MSGSDPTHICDVIDSNEINEGIEYGDGGVGVKKKCEI
jgi:hypothetical protein